MVIQKETKTIQLEVPMELDEWIAIKSIKESFHDKRNVILSILTKVKEKEEKNDSKNK